MLMRLRLLEISLLALYAHNDLPLALRVLQEADLVFNVRECCDQRFSVIIWC